MDKQKEEEISFDEEYGSGSYHGITVTKKEYEENQKKRKVFIHKDNGKRVW